MFSFTSLRKIHHFATLDIWYTSDTSDTSDNATVDLQLDAEAAQGQYVEELQLGDDKDSTESLVMLNL